MNKLTKKDSFIFNQYAYSNNCEIIKGVEIIFSIIKGELNDKYEQDRKNLLNCFLCNILYLLFTGHYLGIHLNKNQYSTLPPKCRIPYYSYRFMVNMIEALKIHGFLLYLPHRHFIENKELNRTTLFYPTEEFLEITGLLGTKEVAITENYPEIIMLREKKMEGQGKAIDYKDSKETLKMRRDLKEYNEFISGVKITYNKSTNTQLYNTYINNNINKHFLPYISTLGLNTLITSQLHRVFSNSDFQQGGRFYTSNFGYQNLSEKERGNILINGENTVELDYQAMHISMLYAKRKIQYNDDPYLAVSNHTELRNIIKKILLISINADNRSKAKKAINRECPNIKNKLRPYNLTLSLLMDKLEQVHKSIADYFFSGQGIFLQNTDSKIMNDLLIEFTKQGKPIFSVHDSAIVQGKDKNLLKNAMKECYRNHMAGLTCEIKEKIKSQIT